MSTKPGQDQILISSDKEKGIVNLINKQKNVPSYEDYNDALTTSGRVKRSVKPKQSERIQGKEAETTITLWNNQKSDRNLYPLLVAPTDGKLMRSGIAAYVAGTENDTLIVSPNDGKEYYAYTVPHGEIGRNLKQKIMDAPKIAGSGIWLGKESARHTTHVKALFTNAVFNVFSSRDAPERVTSISEGRESRVIAGPSRSGDRR